MPKIFKDFSQSFNGLRLLEKSKNKKQIVRSPLIDANSEMQQYAGSTWEQKADSSMKLDGGNTISVTGSTVKTS